MSKQDGGSAFPQVKTTKQYTTDPDVHSVGGMTLRDYFAAKVLASMMSNSDAMNEAAEGCESDTDLMAVLAERSYAMADAMLAAREVAQ